MALVAVLLAMTDFYPDAPLTPGAPVEGLSGNGLLGGWRREVGSTFGLARALAGRAVGGARAVVGDAAHAVTLGEQGAGYGLAAGRLLAHSADPPTRPKGKVGRMKRPARAGPIEPLDQRAHAGQACRTRISARGSTDSRQPSGSSPADVGLVETSTSIIPTISRRHPASLPHKPETTR